MNYSRHILVQKQSGRTEQKSFEQKLFLSRVFLFLIKFSFSLGRIYTGALRISESMAEVELTATP